MTATGPEYQTPPAPGDWFPDRIKLPLRFAPGPLADAIRDLPEDDWTDHFVRANYEGDWSALPLRAGARAKHRIQKIYADPTETQHVDTEFLATMPAFRALLDRLACPLTIVRL